MIVRVFFDIDATLLLTDGAGRAALQTALEAVYGTSGRLEGYMFHGKTDPQIVVELLSDSGISEPEIRGRMSSMWLTYLEALKRELDVRRSERRIRLLPGVAELLAALEREEGVCLGLVTGNIEAAARMKLAAAGVKTGFAVGVPLSWTLSFSLSSDILLSSAASSCFPAVIFASCSLSS